MLLRSVMVAMAILPATSAWAAHPVDIVAAENFYGDIAEQIGGSDVAVKSILSNPAQDPHLFEVSPSVARAVAGARIVIYNGIGYDPWMGDLLRAVRGKDRSAIVAAALIGAKRGANPHIWYAPRTMSAVAKALAGDLARVDAAHRSDYARRLARFEQSLRPIRTKIAHLRRRLAGKTVTATEPVFGYVFDALGMRVENESFQLAVMNDTEPSAADMAAMENDLKAHRVALLVYNSQAYDPVAKRIVGLAKASGVAVVAATETEPPGQNYQQWMSSALDALARALGN